MNKSLQMLMDNPSVLKELSLEQLGIVMDLIKRERASRCGLPVSVMDELVKAVPTSLVRDLVADARRSNEPGMLPKEGSRPVKRGSGWVDAQPLSNSVPGIEHIDRIASYFADIDRAQLIKQSAEAKAVKKVTDDGRNT
jgi:hypothetical protein